MLKDKRILLLLDKDHDRELKESLAERGCVIESLDSFRKAKEEITAKKFDLLLLEINSPRSEAFHFCRVFREKDTLTPIVFISPFNNHQLRLRALQLEVDDYVARPFHTDELLLKIERLIFKNNLFITKDIVEFGNCSIDFVSLEAKGIYGKKIELSKLEFDLARLLISNEGKTLSRKQLYKAIWGYSFENIPNSRTLDNFIVFLRKYFEENPARPKHFIAVRGIGYKFLK